jgi:hypothetical protein
MRRAILTAVVMLFVAIGAVAQEHDQAMVMSPTSQEEHLTHLREMLATMSSHGPVIPQPASVTTQAVTNITVTARSFSFSSSPALVVNQGDVVNLTLTVPANDASSLGHGILMEAYIENGLDCQRGKSVEFQFTATTAGTFAFVCDIPSCGDGHSNMFGTFKVNAVTNPAPSISGIAPTSGSIAGGTAVTITGTNFRSGATVKFGGVSATNVSVTSATSITATAPAHPLGKVDVVVTNSDLQSATFVQGFTYTAAGPTITAVSPGSGTTSGGTFITISGTDFQSGATVTIGGRQATNVTVVSATSITAFTPVPSLTQQPAADVVVTNPDSTKATAAGAFVYSVPALSVLSVTPYIAVPLGVPGAGPVSVTIFGSGFTSGTASVTVGGVQATNVVVNDPVTISAIFPAHAAGTGDVVVTIGSASATLKNGFAWQNPPPRHRAIKH